MNPSAADDARRAIEFVARESYGRLVAFIARGSRDLAAAEDALGDAFRVALATWPGTGVPDNPEAWLLTTARRRRADAARRQRTRDDAAPLLAREIDVLDGDTPAAIPDERLALLFACAHPAIDASLHTPLMLQTVLGLEAADVASAFMTSPGAMAQRLVRAKTKIRDAGIRFDIPGTDELAPRLGAVLSAVYAAFTSGHDTTRELASDSRRGFSTEALHLAGVLARLLPDEPEVLGLHALLLYLHARRDARLSPEGEFVPLDRQDTSRWDAGTIARAEQSLRRAATFARPGRFQLEATLQSVHADRARTGEVRWEIITAIYEALVAIAPATGTIVARAAALSHTAGPAHALATLDLLEPDAVASYQPYWAVRAHLLAGCGRTDDADAAYRMAAGLTTDPAVRRYLLARITRP